MPGILTTAAAVGRYGDEMPIAYATTMHRSAIFSPCRTWRYQLTRRWNIEQPTLMVVGLNPSTADESLDDPTIRRCISFAQRWGCGRLWMLNLFAYRSTNPRGLQSCDDAVGRDNDEHLLSMAHQSTIVLAAWGACPWATTRAKHVKELLADVDWMCLGRTKSGAPKHPLYVLGDRPYEDYR